MNLIEQPEPERRFWSTPVNSGFSMRAGAVVPAVLAHGAGVGGWDEAVIFGGIGLIVGALIFMSWRAGKRRKEADARRRKTR